MSDVRDPAVAGLFYPGDPDSLASTVDVLLGSASAAARPAIRASVIRGLIVPHAGYEYSGPVAASAYALLTRMAPPSTVVVLGPSHYEPLEGLVAAPHRVWRTPLGEAPLAVELRRQLGSKGVTSDERPHRIEHSIEVQLPFVQRCLPSVPVLPVAVGHGSPRSAAGTLDVLPLEALLVVSTDLSHYHDATTARRLDVRTAEAIEALDLDAIAPEDACGADALRVALAWARPRGYRVIRLDLRNSADTAGDPSRVVGYGAFAILES